MHPVQDPLQVLVAIAGGLGSLHATVVHIWGATLTTTVPNRATVTLSRYGPAGSEGTAPDEVPTVDSDSRLLQNAGPSMNMQDRSDRAAEYQMICME